MTRDELVERVARKLAIHNGEDPDYCGDPEDEPEYEPKWWLWMSYQSDAEVVIDVVLEEAARRAAIASLGCSKVAADRIQSAILSLKGEVHD